MTRELLFACSWPILALQSASLIPSDKLLVAIATVESGRKPWAVGDHGLAFGAFQIHKAAWADVNITRKESGKTQFAHARAFDPEISKEYAREFLAMLNLQLSQAMKRYPSPGETYAAYNLGVSGFSRRKFKMERCPITTRNAAARVERLTKWGDE